MNSIYEQLYPRLDTLKCCLCLGIFIWRGRINYCDPLLSPSLQNGGGAYPDAVSIKMSSRIRDNLDFHSKRCLVGWVFRRNLLLSQNLVGGGRNYWSAPLHFRWLYCSFHPQQQQSMQRTSSFCALKVLCCPSGLGLEMILWRTDEMGWCGSSL